ncbi:hypothetical protein M3Y97_00257500 [Aphelenchoides bicaudatus]|nr:hypothetical protein M3Y97_00257500 [Aphelenchoides bicaudatus]
MEQVDIHAHCDHCFKTQCLYSECKIIRCQKCGAHLHSCKMGEHLEEICSKCAVSCPNAQYGCKMQLQRDRVGVHLSRCNAYLIHCNFSWNRSFVSIIAKRYFKRVAKGLENEGRLQTKAANLDTEISMVLRDQDQIFESFKCSRLCRIKQRDFLNRTHPLLPLGYKQQPAVYMAADSSDEEEKDEQIVMRSTPQAFAGCPICRTDPGEQHLHVLGNINAKDEYDPDFKSQPNAAGLPLDVILPSGNLKYNLFLNLEHGHANARSMAEPKNFHMFSCNLVLRRDEYLDHIHYHDDIAHFDGGRFVRCPYGCGFGVEKLMPSRGKFIFKPFFDTVIYTDLDEQNECINISLPKLLSVFSMASDYLDSASLNALSATCSWIRAKIFDYFPHRYLIYRPWFKKRHVDGRVEWKMDSEKKKFSKVQRPTWAIKQNPEFQRALEKHKNNCSYKDQNQNSLQLQTNELLIELVNKMSIFVE